MVERLYCLAAAHAPRVPAITRPGDDDDDDDDGLRTVLFLLFAESDAARTRKVVRVALWRAPVVVALIPGQSRTNWLSTHVNCRHMRA